ncbi:hypothetical protein [Bacillus mycoides]|uniref:hypothetical protein n=1 Tax=Bacillus mycoides TaxID=1405 RepID=UPI00081565B0|nr:hypothetical protein [Bacillus mycoides]SCC39599.1 Uncharacterized protein BW664_03221 [Bacillus mycoides]
MKKLLIVLGTLIIEGGIIYTFAKFINWKFIDITFFSGICITLIIGSKGGFSSNSARLQIQAQTGIKQEEEKFEFKMNPIFIGSFIYILISLLFLIIEYRKYFI